MARLCHWARRKLHPTCLLKKAFLLELGALPQFLLFNIEIVLRLLRMLLKPLSFIKLLVLVPEVLEVRDAFELGIQELLCQYKADNLILPDIQFENNLSS